MVSGFTPFITTLLYLKFGWVGPALLFSTYALIGLIAALLTRETFGRAEREFAAAATDAPVHVSVDHPLPDSAPITAKENHQ